MASSIVPGPMTLEEYLQFEQASSDKHEYVRGYVYPLYGASAMSGASRRHHIIGANIFYRLRSAARSGPCRVFYEGFKLQVTDDVIYYPDAMVLCDESDSDARMARNPCLIVEITSPESARIDRGDKLDAYRQIASLQTYLIVEQAWRRVTRYWRGKNGEWEFEELRGEGTIPIPCPETTLTLDEVYEGLAPLSVKEMEAIGYAVG